VNPFVGVEVPKQFGMGSARERMGKDCWRAGLLELWEWARRQRLWGCQGLRGLRDLAGAWVCLGLLVGRRWLGPRLTTLSGSWGVLAPEGDKEGRVVRLRLALQSALAFALAAMVLSSSRLDDAISGALHEANRQLVVLVSNLQVLEQLGVVCTVSAMSLCAAAAHRQGASEACGGARVLAD
jgi:hypothetical protein